MKIPLEMFLMASILTSCLNSHTTLIANYLSHVDCSGKEVIIFRSNESPETLYEAKCASLFADCIDLNLIQNTNDFKDLLEKGFSDFDKSDLFRHENLFTKRKFIYHVYETPIEEFIDSNGWLEFGSKDTLATIMYAARLNGKLIDFFDYTGGYRIADSSELEAQLNDCKEMIKLLNGN